MYLLRTPSVIRRVLMQRLESRETKNEIISDGENIEVKNSEQEAEPAIHEQGAQPAIEKDGCVSTCFTEDMMGDDLSRLMPLSFVHREDILGVDEPSSLFFDSLTHFGEQSATFFSDLFHELTPDDPFDCFVEQVLSTLSTGSLRGAGIGSEIDTDVVTEFQPSPLSDFNHYHQYVDQPSFNDGCQFSEISSSTENHYFAEVQNDTGATQIKDDSFTYDFRTVEGILGGERLDTGDDDLINYYDGEPIEIGVPVVLEPMDKSSGRVLENGAPGTRNRSGEEPDDQRDSLQTSLPDDDITMDLLDCSWGDVDLTLHADKSWAGSFVVVEKFELGADSLRIESVLETETMETLLDNHPIESVGAGGEHSLCFSIGADSHTDYTISFLGMSLDAYMDFLSSAVRDITVI
ncbi:hypothetical protein [Halodesulfovibrio sp. MK-HDV]|jgi:hypothetical protein|uniref:hypothetical protein n=1 Tax=Halodesulfovibrio sp. MK-HDV TaxID=2599925 RepID=UPI001368294A|nr:hypothetical protein [Halodesulfovibrio sp. MK-HDV]